MTDIPFGKKARISFRFKRADGSDGKVDGLPTINTKYVDEATGGPALTLEDLKQNDDGSWTCLVGGGSGATSVSVSADVDLGPDAKVVDFALAELNFLAEGQTETVSDIVVAVE